MTCYVSSGTLNPTYSLTQLSLAILLCECATNTRESWGLTGALHGKLILCRWRWGLNAADTEVSTVL